MTSRLRFTSLFFLQSTIVGFTFLFLAQACQSDLDCNLNGVCTEEGICRCDVAWRGTPTCSQLQLLPTSIKSGCRPLHRSSWGGSAFYHDGLCHLFPAEMMKNCGLTSWLTDSRIMHATSQTLEGPHTFQQEVVGVWSHNPTILKASDGTLLLLSVGHGSDPICGSGMPPPESCGPTGCCANGTSPCGIHRGHPCNATWPPRPTPDPKARDPLGVNSNFTAFVAPSGNPSGPWMPMTLPTNQMVHQHTPTGPSFSNGTVVVLLGGGGMFRADHWSGPCRRWGEGMHNGCGGEDPFLHTDQRGYWHCLFHAAPFSNLTAAGGHAFSVNGLDWHTTPEPFMNEILHDGAVRRTPIAKRERPHLVFDKEGNVIALTTGMCHGEHWNLCNDNPWPGHCDGTFTHVQLVARSSNDKTLTGAFLQS